MKKHLFILLACCLTTMASAAYEFTDSLGVVWNYTVDESTTPATVTLTGVTNHTTDIVCPDTLYYIVEEDTTCYFITALKDELFKGKSTLTSITLPEILTKIGKSAFYGCSGLTSMTIPASVTTIGSSAFSGCGGIKELTLEDGTEVLTLEGTSSIFSSCPLEKVYWGRDLTYASNYFSSPFYKQTALTAVTIGESVTTIGSYAFYDCSGLTSLTIPASVTTIGSSAFSGCSELPSITIPASVTTIGSSAFSGCSELTSITIPASVTSIGSSAFSCGGIKELTLEDGTEILTLEGTSSIFSSCPLEKVYWGRDLTYASSYNSSPFYKQTALTAVTIGESVTTIGSYAFYDCSGLTSLTIPASVTTIGNSAFNGCSGLTSLTLGDAVTTIGNSAFNGCSGLTSLTLGDAVTTIGNSAFYGCSGLTSLTIPASVTTIGSYAFYQCSGISSLTIGNSVTTIGNEAFSECSGIKELTFEDGTGVLTLEGTSRSMFSSSRLEKLYLGRDLSYSITNSNSAPLYSQTTLTSVVIGDKVTTLGKYLFSGCTGLTSLTLGDAVTTIGDNAFNYCTGLTSLTLGDAVTTIGVNAFMDCRDLTSLTLGDAVTTIGNSAFYQCSSLTSLTLGDAVTTIGVNAFYGCSKLSEVNIKSIESWLNIDFINNNSNPAYISKGLYIDGQLVTDIVVPSTITEIKNYAFHNNTALLSVDLGDAVTTIGDNAFNYCTGLTSLTLGDAVTTIGNSAFYGCNRLTSLTLGDAVTAIGDNAFSCCSGLKDLYIANLDAWAAIEYGSQYSHPNCYATNIYHNDKLVTEVEIPTTITTIPDYTFYNFGDVVKVKLHEGVESIGQSAFQNVPAVFEVAATAVPTLGTSAISAPSVVVVPQEAGTAYSEADGWADLAITTDEVYNQTLTLEAAEDASSLHKTLGDAKLDSVVNLTISGTINSYDFMVMRTKMTKLRNLDLTNATVKYNAYQHYTGYHTADSVIPGYAFYNCNLFGLKLPEGTKSIGTYAIYSNDYLREVVLPEGMTTIGSYAFYASYKLREVIIPEGVTNLGYIAFGNCSKLQSISFPTTLEIIDSQVFASSALDTVDFSNTHLKTIGNNAFNSCQRLVEVKLPAKTLQEIKTLAFCGCSSLQEIRIPSSVRTVGDQAFKGCTKLEKIYVYTVEPISIGQHSFELTGNNFVGALYAPRVSYYTYWYDTQWGQFQSINEFDEPYEYAYFEGDKTFDTTTGTVEGDGENHPDADMGNKSGTIVNGAENATEGEEGGETPAAANGMRRTQATATATLTQEWGTLNVAHNGTDGASIIAKNGGAVTAETANFRINVTGGKWYFLSFPFDIKKENIKCEGGANYVFRYYDGTVRATKGSGGWTNVAVADDGIYLKAGKGYIFQASKSDVLVLTVEDMSIVSEDKNTTVEAYAADNTANASWNFVGNPYLSYYNVTAADYSAPITVWNGSSYQAVRPGDDEYQLAPFEAFFVQKPEGVNGITYATTSQTTYQKIQAAAAAAPGRRTAEINPDRLLVNIALTDGTTADQTRVVFNNAVSMDYEMECDAAKFSTAGVPQLYTIDSRAVKYAINERPVAEGVVTMGFTAPAQGVYTLSAPRMDTPMLLRDNATGTIHDFAEGSYEFASEAGTFDDRFTLMMKAGETTSIDNSQWTIDDEAPVYNTKGQRVNEATEQGIYIKGNRKVVTL